MAVSIFSPWGHPTRVTPPFSGFNEITKSYKIIPFATDKNWNFLSRDISIESEEEKKEYVPQREDKFIFLNESDYSKKLTMIRDLSEAVDKQIQKAGIPIEDVDPDYLRNNTGMSEIEWESVAFLRSEAEILRKFTIQRKVSPYWYVTRFDSNDKPVTDFQKKIFRAFMTHLRKAITSKGGVKKIVPIEDLSDPIDTNVGGPLFSAELQSKLQLMNMFQGAFAKYSSTSEKRKLNEYSPLYFAKEIRDNIIKISDKQGMSASLMFGVAANRRYGPSRKWTPLWIPSGNDITATKEIQNLPRMRNVFMAPYVYNLILSPFLRVMKAGRKALIGWWHDEEYEVKKKKIANDIKRKNGKLYSIESDVSALDKNMSLPHRIFMINELYSMYEDLIPNLTLDAARQHSSLSYLIPDFLSTNPTRKEGIECVPKQGCGLYSGIKLTSEIDSYFVMWATLTSLVKAGVINIKDVENGTWYGQCLIENQGDDVLIRTGSLKNIELITRALTETYNHFGVTAKMALGCRFLMQHTFSSGKYPVLSRILQQTYSNEHIRRDWNLFELGLAARTKSADKLIKLMRGHAQKCSQEVSKGILMLIDGLESILSSAASGSVVDQLLHTNDNKRQQIISKISMKLVNDKQTHIRDKLMKIMQDERFSKTGQELRDVIEKTELAKLLVMTEEKKKQVYVQAMKSIGMLDTVI